MDDVQNLQRLCRRVLSQVHTCLYLSLCNFILETSHSVCLLKGDSGLKVTDEITCLPLETSVYNEPSQYFPLNYVQEAKSLNSISFYLCFLPLQLKPIIILKHRGSLKGSP